MSGWGIADGGGANDLDDDIESSAVPAQKKRRTESAEGEYMSISELTPAFRTSGEKVMVCVKRIFPLVIATAPSGGRPTAMRRVQFYDHNTAESEPIEGEMYGVWAEHFKLDATQTLIFTHTIVAPRVRADPIDRDIKLVWDESPQSSLSQIKVRLGEGAGQTFTRVSLQAKKDASPAATAAAAAGTAFVSAAAVAAAAGGTGSSSSSNSSGGGGGGGGYRHRSGAAASHQKKAPAGSSSSSAAAAATAPNRKYSVLAGLQAMNMYHVYGIVTKCQLPKQARSGNRDWMLSFNITDDSFPVGSSGVLVNIFRKTEKELPALPVVGDIVRIHSATVQEHQSVPCIVIPAQRERSYNILIVDANQDVPVARWKSGEAEAAIDVDRVHALRQWSVDAGVVDSARAARSLVTISTLSSGFKDMLCKIVSVEESENRFWIWDGTETKYPYERFVPVLKNDVVLPGGERTPMFGSLVPVHADLRPDRQLFPYLKPTGIWVTFRGLEVSLGDRKANSVDSRAAAAALNAASAVAALQQHLPVPQRIPTTAAATATAASSSSSSSSGSGGLPVLRVLFKDKSSFDRADAKDTSVLRIQSEYDSRLAATLRDRAELAALDRSKFVSGTYHPERDFTNIKAVQNHPHATNKFKIRVRVTDYFPRETVEISRRTCTKCHSPTDLIESKAGGVRCKKCPAGTEVKYSYFLRLCVRDASGVLSVLVSGLAADTFFGGLPACNLAASDVTRAAIEKKLQLILHPDSVLDMCVSSYSVALASLSTQLRIAHAKEAASRHASQHSARAAQDDLLLATPPSPPPLAALVASGAALVSPEFDDMPPPPPPAAKVSSAVAAARKQKRNKRKNKGSGAAAAVVADPIDMARRYQLFDTFLI